MTDGQLRTSTADYGMSVLAGQAAVKGANNLHDQPKLRDITRAPAPVHAYSNRQSTACAP